MQKHQTSTTDTVVIDGQMGEGGGQVLRSSLTLSLCSGRPARIKSIRAGRRKPGLMRQHLACLRAAATISNGTVSGDELGSQQLTFAPGKVEAGDYHFAVGSAGSAALVLQTILLPLLLADGPSTVRIEGGTHNAWAPPVDFLQLSFLPQLQKMGAEVELRMERVGFFPAGGGILFAKIKPVTDPKPFTLLERGVSGAHYAMIRRAHIPANVADREWDAMRRVLFWESAQRRDIDHLESAGPGNSVHCILQFENVTEVISSFGSRQRGAKQVGREAGKLACSYINGTAPVGMHLADQLLLPMLLLGGGEFITEAPTKHTVTNIDVIHLYYPGRGACSEMSDGNYFVEVQK